MGMRLEYIDHSGASHVLSAKSVIVGPIGSHDIDPPNGNFYPITTRTEEEWRWFMEKRNAREFFDWNGDRVVVLKMHRHSTHTEGSVTLWGGHRSTLDFK